jgi:hypothetical protein
VNIINDSLMDKIMFLGYMVGAIITGILAAFIAPVFGVNEGARWAMVGAGFLIGWVIMALVLQVMESGVATLYVCFAEDKEALRRNDPALYQAIMDTYGGQVLDAMTA